MMHQGAPRHDAYDVIVVGGGMGGLSVAALLARVGRSVLLVERADGVGGYLHAFRSGPYTFDPAVHVTTQGEPGQLYDAMLSYLEVEERPVLQPLDGFATVHMPDGFRLDIPMQLEACIEAHTSLWPHERDGIRRFFELAARLQWEIHQMSMSVSLRDLDAMVEKYPSLFRYRLATVQDVLDEMLTDDRCKAVCAASWPYQGLGPERLGFLTFAQVLMNHLESNQYCMGGFQVLADTIAGAIEQHGGEVLVGTSVDRIVVRDGRVGGVVLEGGEEVRAEAVVSNADALHTFEELVGEENLPASWLKRLRRMTVSLPAFTVFCATTIDTSELGTAHETFFNDHWDQNRNYDDVLRGVPGGTWVNTPSTIDPSLAPEGEHVVIVHSLAPWDPPRPWAQHREEFAEILLERVERVIPGLRDNLTFCETATPETMARYTNNTRGAMYGWENTPRQTGTKRLDHTTPIDNLYLSGHWTMPGSGSLRAFASGIHTAMIYCAQRGLGAPIPTFEEADLPSL